VMREGRLTCFARLERPAQGMESWILYLRSGCHASRLPLRAGARRQSQGMTLPGIGISQSL
jgi:hypothetical protein